MAFEFSVETFPYVSHLKIYLRLNRCGKHETTMTQIYLQNSFGTFRVILQKIDIVD